MQLGRTHKTTRNAELRFLREGNERAPQALRVVGFRSYADINDAPEHTNAFLHMSFRLSARRRNKQLDSLLSWNRS